MSQLSAQTSRLVRNEMRLAQREFKESVRHAGIGAGLISAADLPAVLGSVTMIAAAVAALSVLPVWAAALIVALVLFVGAGIAALVSKKQAERVTQHAVTDNPKTSEPVAAIVVAVAAGIVIWRRRH